MPPGTPWKNTLHGKQSKEIAAAKKDKEAKKLPKPGELKKYEDVITDKAKTTKGVFTVHRIEDKVYFEIPRPELNKDLLLVVQIAKSPSEASYPGESVQDMVVRWELRENKVLLRSVSFANIADPSEPIHAAVEAMNTGTITGT